MTERWSRKRSTARRFVDAASGERSKARSGDVGTMGSSAILAALLAALVVHCVLAHKRATTVPELAM